MTKETISKSIVNGDSTNPIRVSVVQSTADPTKNGIVLLNPDGSSIAGGGGGSSTLAQVSTASNTTAKSLYQMTSAQDVEFKTSDASTLLYLDETNKRIGIGTNAPSDSLSLSGNSATRIGTTWLNTNSSPATSAFLGAYSGNMQMGTVSNHPFYLETNNTVRISIAAAGNIGIGLNSGSAKLHVLATTEQLRLGYDASNYASFTVTSGGLLNIAPTGTNVGINVASPSSPLHVVGAIRTQRSGIDTQYIETWGGDAGATYFSSYSTTSGQKILRFRNLVTGGAATDATNQFAWDLNTDSSILQIATLSFGSGFKVNRSNTTTQFLSVNGGDSSGIYLTGQSATSAEKILYISNFTNGTATSANGMQFRVGDVGTPVTAGTIDYLGKWGIGTTSPAGKLHVLETTEQLRLGYDVTNYTSFTVSSAGDLTIAPTGGDVTISTTLSTTQFGTRNMQIGNIESPNNGLASLIIRSSAANINPIRVYRSSDAAAVFYIENETAGSKIGIGTFSPAHKLDTYLSSSSTGISSIYGLRDIPSGTISSGSSINGVQGQLAVGGTTTITTITATGGNFIAEHDGSSTVHALVGLRGWARTNAASTGVLASAYSLYAVAPANSQAGNTITNAYSLYIESPTAGATLNYGLYQDGSANNYFGGAVGVGSIPAAKLHSLSTTEQLRVGYDASNYYSTTVGSTGGVTFDAVGAGALFTFSDDVRVTTAGTNTASVVTVGGSQSLTGKTYNGLTITTTTGTLTITNAKTLSVSNTITLAGTDSTTMTFPTTSKTIAANDGTNWALASQAAGDLLVASSASAYSRLAIGTSGFALHSNGTTAAWETDYALTFGYQLSTSVATGDITVTLLNYLGTTPSTTTPVRFMVGSTLVTYTSATTLTINNDSFYHFNAGSAELATYEIDYFVYVASSGGLCVSRLPWYTNFAQQGANQEAFLANGGGFSTQDLQNIGRYNATKASGTTGNWSIPATSIIINKPIYYTRALNFTPTLQGSGGSIGTMTASPYTGTYTVRDSACFYRLNVQCTNVGSWSGNVELNLPWINKNEMGDNPVTGWVCPSGANPATASRAVPYTVANSNLQRHLSGVDTANLSWGTFVVNDRIRAEGFYNIV